MSFRTGAFSGVVGLVLSLSQLACAGQTDHQFVHHYTVRVDDTLEGLAVSACFDGVVPPVLMADDTAMLHLENMWLRSVGGTLKVENWIATLADVPANACVEYSVRLRPETSGVQKGGPETRRIGRDLLTSIGDWLWRPEDLAEDKDIEIRFELPPGVNVSTPWKQVGDHTYRLGHTPRKWPGVVAFGGFDIVEIELAGARLHLAMMDGPTPEFRKMLENWVARAASSLTTVYGHFPVAQLQVIVAPTARGNKPVPWAYVARGGGSAVHLFIRPNFPEDAFMRDWSLVHEMSHLFLPYMEWGDGWLVEGLPTYYQNVAMARGGLIAPEEAWRRMFAGFESARQVGAQYTVYEAGERLGRRGLYKRVYWGGAAYMLMADLRLRQVSRGATTFGDVLREIGQCCLAAVRRWPAEEFVAKLDTISHTTLFTELFEEQIKSQLFPEYEATFAELGIQMLGGHPIFVDGTAVQFRNAIMAPR